MSGLKKLPTQINKVNGSFEVSAYHGGTIGQETIHTIKLLKNSFPELSKEFHDVLSERAIALGFNDQRFKDAVNHVIDTCEYPRPTIAKFIGWDKKIKLLSYDQLLQKNDDLNGCAFKYYKSIRISDEKKPFFAHVNDIKEFNLTLWNE